ncbi:MAG: hypothetical protein A2W18_00645 [Candidatus Muproteobacteria bacterium RBG_16_60_9]|uniref:Cthe-2314-like HEPN domain-containing protein n=1 Tax=Candidatus Muproteobacteria bacterium RBG_16_60_9 TaxID=1817755 RepID=A0A1F6V538_9PROT|nr:MAG: hypothetical protein A2W18_00645 [Candidatus Muproteobacteria bacterium RBG_16_60_9]
MYTSDQLGKILTEKEVVIPKIAVLLDQHLMLCPRLPLKAQEHCQFGVCRRLFILVACLEYFFSELPPDTNKERSREENSRANIHLHAFLINVSGIIDNMAWLWAHYIGLEQRFDLEKKKTMIGLFNKDFLEHLPKGLAALVGQYSKWHEFLTHHRHPTAHRIPPYMIPYTVRNEEDSPELRNYMPRYIGSFGGKYGPIPLHVQSLADVNTVLALSEALLTEMKAHHA